MPKVVGELPRTLHAKHGRSQDGFPLRSISMPTLEFSLGEEIEPLSQKGERDQASIIAGAYSIPPKKYKKVIIVGVWPWMANSRSCHHILVYRGKRIAYLRKGNICVVYLARRRGVICFVDWLKISW